MSSETHTVWEDTKEVRDSGLDSDWSMKVGITNGRMWSLPTTHELPADILHPLATIQWETCWELGACELIGASTVDSVVLNDKLYLGVFKCGLHGSGAGSGAGMVLEFSADFAAWKVLPLPPVSGFTLSTYHSQLVLVGGLLNGTTSNKLWVYDNDAWHCSLPPMLTGREYPVVVNTGTPEYLVVAGGHQAVPIEVVEVLMEGQWVSCAPLYSNPTDGCIHNGNLYFSCERNSVVYCQLESLVKACVQPDGVSDTGGLWNCLPLLDVYIWLLAAYGKFLICLTTSGDLHALSPDTESWVHVGRRDTGGWEHRLMTLCTGELAAFTDEYKSLHVKLLSVKGMCPWQVFKLIAQAVFWTCIQAHCS